MSLYSSFVQHLALPMALWRRGESAQLRYLREFEQTQFLSAEELRQLQWQRAKQLITHAAQRCPYYRHTFRQMGITPGDLRSLDDWRALPILEKTQVQEQSAEMIAEGWPAQDLIRNQTGGSTGTPLTFYLTRDRKCSRAAATLRHNRWAGWEIGDSAAVIWGAPRDRPASGWRTRLREALLREPLWLDTACLTEASMASFHQTLLRKRPKIILGYARSCVLFAQWLEATGTIPHSPHSIITSAEVLEDQDRVLLERVFACPVFNRYGCREVSVLASECAAHQGMHVMAEGLYVEIETPSGPAAPGELGSILVTDLLNLGMPLIRYRIGDLGAWAAGKCRCGRALPRLEKVAGRVTDFLVGSDGRLVSGVYLATYVVAQRPSLGQVRLEQDRPGHVIYNLCPGKGFEAESDQAYLQSMTQEHLGGATTMEIRLVREIPRASSGKFVFSRSEVTPKFLTGKQNG